jgi:hypothetical protein
LLNWASLNACSTDGGSVISDLEVPIMKMVIRIAATCAVLIVPAVSFAQPTNAPLTRAQVLADLVRLEQSGYNPAVAEDPQYPADIQAAEARAAALSANAGVGGAAAGNGQAGNAAGLAAPVTPTMPMHNAR